MGAAPFSQYADGADPHAAFRTARDDARHEHGHGGYSGSLAEKDDYAVICAMPMDLEQARRSPPNLIGRADPRIDDQWGPAGAIAERQPTRTVTSMTSKGPRPTPGSSISTTWPSARRPPGGVA